MSAKRPYKIAVGGDHYMVTATTREQAGRIALGAYPSPVVEVTAASPTEVMEWLQAGKQIFDKDTFVARSIPTVVLYCTADGQIAADTEFRIEPGNYHLVVELWGESGEPAMGAVVEVGEDVAEQAAAAMTEADIADAEAGPEGMRGGDASYVVADEAADYPVEAAAELEPEAADGDAQPLADMDRVIDPSDFDEDGTQAMFDDMVADQRAEEAALEPFPGSVAEDLPSRSFEWDVVPGCNHPDHRGAFAGDIFYGDPEDSTRGTHIWRKGRWNAYMRSDDDKIAE